MRSLTWCGLPLGCSHSVFARWTKHYLIRLLDVTGRTAKHIIELSGEDEFTIPVTQEELAGMVGITRAGEQSDFVSFGSAGSNSRP